MFLCLGICKAILAKILGSSSGDEPDNLWKFQLFVSKLATATPLGLDILADEWLMALVKCTSWFSTTQKVLGSSATPVVPHLSLVVERSGKFAHCAPLSALEKLGSGFLRAYSHNLAGTKALAHHQRHVVRTILFSYVALRLVLNSLIRLTLHEQADAGIRTILRAFIDTGAESKGRDHTPIRDQMIHFLSSKYSQSAARWTFGSYPALVDRASFENGGVECEVPIITRLNFVIASVLHESDALQVRCLAVVTS